MTFFSGCSDIFYLSLVLSSLIIICLSVVFFMLFVLRLYWASCICGLEFSASLKESGHYFFKCFICPHFSVHSPRNPNWNLIRLLEVIPQLDAILVLKVFLFSPVFNMGSVILLSLNPVFLSAISTLPFILPSVSLLHLSHWTFHLEIILCLMFYMS